MIAFSDLESDGLLPVLSTIHSLVVKINNNVFSYAQDECINGVKQLQACDTIVGHNFISFDAQAINKVYNIQLEDKVLDTLNLSRLIYPNLLNYDYTHGMNNKTGLPKKLYGNHSLEAWGYRLGILKGEFGKTTDWDNWSEEMQAYCEQDVAVTEALYYHLMEQKPAPLAVEIEMKLQRIIAWQEREGVPFDIDKAQKLARELQEEVDELKKELVSKLPPKVTRTTFIPKRDNKTRGYKKGVPVEKVKEEPFNPASRQQIIQYLKTEHGWIPTEYTDKGNPKVTGEDLEELGKQYPEVELIRRYLDASKILSMLATGKQAWLNFVCNGRIHGRVITNGAHTGRATHSNPNLAQVPSPRAYRGKECRELFYAPEGHVIVGADASGLELRMLAHYLYPYDHGKYAQVILEGDVHTHNQESAGLETRDKAKTFIYSFLYGCGAAKTGAMCFPDKSEFEQKILGKQVQQKFMTAIAGFQELLLRVKGRYNTRGYLVGLDGRILQPVSEHSALNTLLQGAGAIVCKYWINKTWELLRDNNLDAYCYPALWVHDEQQVIVKEEVAEDVGKVIVEAIQLTGEELKINIPLDGEYKIGKNWYETH